MELKVLGSLEVLVKAQRAFSTLRRVSLHQVFSLLQQAWSIMLSNDQKDIMMDLTHMHR